MADTCPKCGFAGVSTDKCPQCHVVIPVYEAYLEKLRRGPSPSASAGGGSAFTRPPADAPPAAAVTVIRTPAASASRRLTFKGSGGALFGMQVVNTCLTLLTLGVYYFWGKAKVRAYLLSQTEFEGDRFAYHGTGKEMFLGYLKAMVLIGVPALLLRLLPEFLDAPLAVQAGAQLLLGLLVGVFVPVAMVGARRYRLSRTSWRGIRFSFRGPTRDFVNLFLNGSLRTTITLGVYYPCWIVHRQAFMVSHSYLGSGRFGFDGRGRDLLWPWLRTLLLFIPTLGLAWFWFSARRQRYFAEHTTFGGARFASTVRGRDLAGFTLVNWLLLIGTLGIATPWVTVRSLRFSFRYLSLEGAPDFSAVKQDARAASASGEGLSGLLDADFGVT